MTITFSFIKVYAHHQLETGYYKYGPFLTGNMNFMPLNYLKKNINDFLKQNPKVDCAMTTLTL